MLRLRKGLGISMTIKDGWRGRFFEDFEVGDVYRHPLGRTVTTTDNAWFTLLTQNTAGVLFSEHKILEASHAQVPGQHSRR